ncbi:tRNA pseudouridine synthase-like 1 [Habropoda laboriosa]|uniref:tRNA pseudouridine synthase n=1 Tax=Habropoda laboriosa TaxID=597456 RepID=A0A0L7R7J1_9HYME|nr:PREDICTED: tRNA pseudouridine synthase-like 1 [Habropoda laboriosa]KOC66819.1 tRNA pseudouridine synthase-like 1 [Habropoda laboriosa]
MGRYFIKFSYLGTQYRGMQKNIIPREGNILMHDTDTIQGTLETALTKILPKCTKWPKLTCSSRTDSGVHSLCNTAHVDIENKLDYIYNPHEVLKIVNRHLNHSSHDIRLLEFIPVNKNFHARKLAKSRTYIYRFGKAKYDNEHRLPLAEIKQSFHLSAENFDFERVKCAIQLFMGLKDFRTFSAKNNSSIPINYVRQLNSFTLEKSNPLMPYDPLSENYEYWHFVVSGRSFLYNQVRRMVGALLALGVGRITERDINIMLQVPGHHNWLTKISMVPPRGLYLVNIEYCQEELDKYTIKYKLSSDSERVEPIEANEI